MRRTCATRRTAVAVTERAAAGVLCLVLRFFGLRGPGAGVGVGKNGGDTPPVAPAVPVVERDAEGGGGGGLTDGPLDGRTNRGSNPRPRRAPAMAHTTRPSMPLTCFCEKLYSEKFDSHCCAPPTHCKPLGTGANAPLWVLDRLDVQGPSRHGLGEVRQPREVCSACVQCTVAIFRRRAMSMHQAGVYPSG